MTQVPTDNFRTFMGGFICLAAIVLLFAFGLSEGWKQVAQTCDDYGKFKNDGKVYICKLEPAP